MPYFNYNLLRKARTGVSSAILLLICLVNGRVHAQVGCTSCANTFKAQYSVIGTGSVTFGDVTITGNSSSMAYGEIELTIPPSGLLDWNASAQGSPGSGASIFSSFTGKLRCREVGGQGGAGFCEEEDIYECCMTSLCPWDCQGIPQCPEDESGSNSGAIRIIPYSDSTFNSGAIGDSSLTSSQPSAPGDLTKKVPDTFRKRISLGRVQAGVLNGNPYGNLVIELPLNSSLLKVPSYGQNQDDPDIWYETFDSQSTPEFGMGQGFIQYCSPKCLSIIEEVKDAQNLVIGFRVKSYDPQLFQYDEIHGYFEPVGTPAPLSEMEVVKVSYQIDGESENFIQTKTKTAGGDYQIEAFSTVPTSSSSGLITQIHGNRATQTESAGWQAGIPEFRLETVTELLKDPVSGGFVPVKETTNTYRKFVRTAPAWTFDRIVESTTGSGAQARTAYSFYEENPASIAFGKLIAQFHPDGSWVRQEYGTTLNHEGELEPIKIYTPWLDAAGLNLPVNATRSQILAAIMAVPAAQCRVEEVQYLTYPDRTIRRTTIAGRLVSMETETRIVVIDPFTGDRVLEKRRMLRDGTGQVLSETREGLLATAEAQEEAWETVLYTIQADGTRTTREVTVDYSQNNLQAQTVTHGTVAQPAGVTGRSLREIHSSDAHGPIRSASELKLAGSYAVVEETLYQQDEVNGSRVERVFKNGEETQTTIHHLDGSIETVDESGIRTVQHTDPVTGVTTLTRVGGGAITEGALTLFNGADMVTTTETFPLPVLAGGEPAGWRELVTTLVGGVSRVESETEFDVHGRVVRVTDAQGITRTTSWTRAANGTETQTETLPGGVTRITAFYQDGRVRSVTGTSLVAQHYDYEMLPGGKLRQTTYQHQSGSSRWQSTLTDAAGRVVREESPGAGSQLMVSNRIWSEQRYNDLGHLVELKRSGGLAAELYEYDALGRLFRRGLDANGNGQLDMQSNDSLTEFHEGYEQRAGVWWQVQRTRVYAEEGDFLEYGRRTQVGGGSETMSESIDPGGAVTTVQVILDRATATRTTRTLRPGASEPEESVEKQGMLIKSRSAQTHPVWGLQAWTDFRELAEIHQPGGIRSFQYDATGRRVSETLTAADASDQVTTYSYLPANVLNAGKLASRTAPYSPLANGAVSTVFYQYDPLGRETAQWGPGTYPVQYEYNDWGERKTMRTWRTQTDGSALPPVNEASLTTWEYDPGSGLLLAKKDAENRQTAYSYRTGTRLLSSRQWARQNGQGQPLATLYEHDALGRLTQISYNDGITHSVRYSYRRDGSVAAIEDAAGRRVMSDWSAQGRAQREVITASSLQDRPDLLVGLQWQQPLDALGRRAGHSGQFAHGGIALELPSATWAYDAATGRMSSVQSGGLTAAWAWSHSATQSTRTLARSSSASQAQPSLTSVQEQNLGRGLFSHSHSRSGSVIQSRTRGTLANSHQIEYRDPHFGVVGGANEMSTWIYGSDPRGQITSARKRLDAASGAPFAPGWDASYAYDDLGNRVTWGQGSAQQTDLSDLEPTSYSRNALHQYTAITGVDASRVTGQAPASQEVKINGVTAERAGHFYHRRVQDGARSDLTLPHWLEVTVTATTTLPNAQTVTAQRAGSLWQPPIPEEPVYDFDGNLIEDGRWLYTWDAENRLIQMLTRQDAVAAGAPNWRLSFAYDHQSRRIQKKVEVFEVDENDPMVMVWKVRSDARFIYDGWNVVAEVELNGAAWDAPGGTSAMDPRPAYVRRSWVWGEDVSGTLDGAGGVGGLLVVTRHARGGQGRESYWAMSDLNGNVTGLVSTSSTRMAVYEYDAFGRLLRENEPEPGLNPVRFSSKYQDVETGLVYYGFRYYSPELGRWINRDPIGERGGINLYGMVGNDAVNRWDLLGKLDPRTEGHIAKLHPKLQPLARQHITSVNANMPRETRSRGESTVYTAKIIQSHRTYAEQDALYNQGRNGNPGPRVTNAKGGYSNHNFKLAYDIAFFCGATVKWDGWQYDVAGRIGKAYGLVWGGSWTSIVDKPHFEYPHGLTMQDLRDQSNGGQDDVDVPDVVPQVPNP